MSRIVQTNDGSQTVYSSIFDEHYHSVNGAVSESMHVFIIAGLRACKQNPVHILEIGFGTGLNALLTYQEAVRNNLEVFYHSIELYPLSEEVWSSLKYTADRNDPEHILFSSLHQSLWNVEQELHPCFCFKKIHADLLQYNPDTTFDLVYFDAFSPERQPELWSREVFQKLYSFMNPEGILVTYCAKGQVRRNLIAEGFSVERLPGSLGKREMIRAIKKSLF